MRIGVGLMRCRWGRSIAMISTGLMLAGCLSAASAQGGDGRRRSSRNEPVVATKTVTVGGATIQVDFAAGDLDLSQDEVAKWVETSARSVAMFYRRFPVARA